MENQLFFKRLKSSARFGPSLDFNEIQCRGYPVLKSSDIFLDYVLDKSFIFINFTSTKDKETLHYGQHKIL